MRPFVLALVVTAASTTLSACGTSSYCTAVEKHRAAFDGTAVTTASLTELAEALRAIEPEAPTHIADEFAAVAAAVETLLEAESAAGVPVEELTHGDVVDLSEDDTAELRAAYQEFNDTALERRHIAEDVADDCDISFKAPA